MNDSNRPIVAIDSNIWLYAMLPKQDPIKEKAASSLIQQNGPNIVISTQIVNEIINNMLRKGQIDEPSVRFLLNSLYHQYPVVIVAQAIQEKASFLREAYSLSHWDGLVVAAALDAKATILYSEDMHHGLVVEKQLTIVNPFIA